MQSVLSENGAIIIRGVKMEFIEVKRTTPELILVKDLHDLHNNKDIKRIILESQDPHHHQTNVKAKMTGWQMENKHPSFKNLAKNICENYAYEYLIKRFDNFDDVVRQKIAIVDMWGIIYQGDGKDHTVPHSHHWNHISFVYYAEADDESSPLVFTDYDNYSIQPKTGRLVIFDSRAKHYVPPFDSKNTRTVVSGNIQVINFALYDKIIQQMYIQN